MPFGAEVVAGAVRISQPSPTVLNITQSSDRAIVNWQSFDIAAGNSVNVAQPSTTSAALFRVTGDTDSRIAGSLSANGQVYLINPNGIAIGAGARIDTHSFVASTLDIADADFLSGNFNFRRTGAARGIYNGGTITATGDVALLGSSVVNEGVVSARLGRIGYGAGDAITLDFAGDRFLSIAVPVADAAGLKDVLGRDLAALITAGGQTEAQGGRIYISARAARDLMLGAVKIDGSLVASTVREGANGLVSLGSIEIDGGDGLIQHEGKIDAGGGTGLAGGTATITGGAVGLGGSISVAGDAGGGTIDVAATNALSLAGTVDARGLRGNGGAISYTSGGSISENVNGVSDASGGLSGGTISVMAGGELATSGTYRANGLLGAGGRIDLTGGSVGLLSTRIAARGLQQGGLVRIGGAFQGGASDRLTRSDYQRFEGRFGALPGLANATTTFINDGVTIDTSSARGIGGGAIVWSDLQTTMLGTLKTTGMTGGGTAEISGKDELRYVDLSTIDTGAGGNLLLDPSFITIGTVAQASAWQYALVIGGGLTPGVPGIGDLEGYDQFGVSVALNAAGNRMAVGMTGDDGLAGIAPSAGAVRLFTFADASFNGGALVGTIGRGYTGAGNFDVGAGLEANDAFGLSVALNGPGDRLAVGAPGDDGFGNVAAGSGAVRLFTFTNTSFAGAALAGTIGQGYAGAGDLDLGATLEAGDAFGTSVSLNAAGDRLAAGAQYDNGFGNVASHAGAVRLFTFSNNSFGGGALAGTIGRGYTGAGDLDLGTALEADDTLGSSVSLNAAGDRLAVGAAGDAGFLNDTLLAGAVRLFTFTNTSFGGAALAGTIGRDYTGAGDLDLGTALETVDSLGSAVALNAAGNRLAVGAYGDDGFGNTVSGSGAVRLFTFGNGSFGSPALTGTVGRGYSGTGNVDLGTALEANDALGSSVALNAAGDRLAVGAAGDDGSGNVATNSGAVRLFTFTDTSFGGATLAGTLGYGYATGYTINLGGTLETSDQFGTAVSLNAAGDRLAVGATGDAGFGNVASGSGAVRLFTFADTSFGGGRLAGTIGRGYTGTGNLDLGTALEATDNFGASVSLDAAGDRLAVGAPNDDGYNNGYTNIGSVRLFTFTDTSFGGAALAGTIGRGYSGTGDLSVTTTLRTGDALGTSVSLNAAGNRLAVGATGDDGSNLVYGNAGAVRLFTFADTNFGGAALAGTLGRGYTGTGNLDVGTAADAADAFGASVALNAAGDRLAVGATGDDAYANNRSNAGAVRLFTFTDTSFGGAALAGTIGANYNGASSLNLFLDTSDNFGASVALNAAGDRLAAGANLDDGPSNGALNSGAVRLFTFTNTSFGGPALAGTIGRGYTGTGNVDLGTPLEASDQFGKSVSLNAAGDRLAAGATYDAGFGNIATQSGSVRLFTFSDTSFGGGALAGTIGRGYTGATFDLGTALEGGDALGTSVSLNAAGDRLAVGAYYDSGFGNVAASSGSVRLFTFTNASFGGAALAGTIGRGYTGTGNLDISTALRGGDNFGTSVSLNAAGDRLAVGAQGDNGFANTTNDAGAVRLFTFTNTSFGGTALAGTIGRGYVGTGDLDLGTALEGSDYFGYSVSLNGAGDRLAVGAPGDDGSGNGASSSGSVRLFTFSNTSFGGAALAGTIGRNYTGSGNLDLGTALESNDFLGYSVSLNAVGDRLAVGAVYDGGFGNVASSSGAVRLFTFTDGSFGGGALAGTIGRGYVGAGDLDLGSALEPGDVFGASLSLNAAGDRLAVGALNDDGFGNIASNTGAIRLFTFTDTSFGGGALGGTIGRGYVGTGDFDTTGGPVGQIGQSVAYNGDASSLVFGSPNSNIVVALRAATVTPSVASLAFADNPSGTSTVSVSALQTALSSGQSISFEASNDITLQNDLTVNNPSGNGGALSLRAGRSILLNASIVTDNANLTLIANSGGSALTTVNTNRLAGAAAITMAAGTSIDAGAGTVAMTLASGAGLTIPTSGAITLGSITAGTVQVDNAGATSGSDVALRSDATLTASGSGRAIDIRAENGTFTNNAGASTLTLTGGGTYAVFSAAPATTLEGVTGYLKRYNVADASAFAALNPGGNFFAYRIAPILTITPDSLSRQYGDANPSLTYGLTGFIDGDTAGGSVTGAPSLMTLADLTSNVGPYAITTTIGTLASEQGYQFGIASGTMTVTARPLTITADALSRLYGDANPALTYTIGGQGLVNGDTLSGALATSATLISNVGNYAITQGTLAASSNYTVAYTGANLDITARPLTITADALSRLYGNANPALTYTIRGQGLVNGDALSGALATGATLTSNVGSYAIMQGTLAATSNYTVAYTGANLGVTARPLTITADALSRLYGDANPALTYTLGGQGLVNGDALTGALATAATLTSDVGSYAISQGTLAASSNYTVAYTGANLGVTARPLTVTADALSRLYGNANPALTYTIGGQGLVNGDALSGALATSATLISNVGNYAITQGTLAASSNYTVAYTGANLDITARPLTITADALSRLYGNANPALTYTLGGQGLVNGDALSGALATSATLTSNVGSYAIMQGTLAATSNYTVAYTGANLTIAATAAVPTTPSAAELTPSLIGAPVTVRSAFPVAATTPADQPIAADRSTERGVNQQRDDQGCAVVSGSVCVTTGSAK